jgi:hypothetical protein
MADKFELGPKATRRIGLFVIICVLTVIGALVVKFVSWLF